MATKEVLQERNEQLVRIANRETDRADAAEAMLAKALLVIPERHEELIAAIRRITEK